MSQRIAPTLSRLFSSASPPGKVKVEFLFDIVSPFAFIQFERLTRQRPHWPRMDLVYQPIFARGVMTGASNPGPLGCPVKTMYNVKDMARQAKYFKVPLTLTDSFAEQATTHASLGTMRFLTALQPLVTPAQFENIVRVAFTEFFHESGTYKLDNEEHILKVALKAGIDESLAKKCLEAAKTSEVKEQLKDATAKAVDMGAFGVPITFVHVPGAEPEHIWGSDRLHIIGSLIGESNDGVVA